MCNRYPLVEFEPFYAGGTGPLFGETLQRIGDLIRDGAWEPRYNAGPTVTMPVVLQRDGAYTLELMRWGLVPSWAKELPKAPLTNARSETIAELPSFRSAFKARRCVVPANGYIEFSTLEDGKTKQGHFIHPEGGGAIWFAGLWERCEKLPTGPVQSYAIATQDSGKLPPEIRTIHDRTPVILSADDVPTWLDPATPAEELLALLAPRERPELTAYRLHRRVNNVRYQEPDALAPLVETPGFGALLSVD